jgi:prepilin-type N-terminal cleavage/methylation domain-containing protein
MNGPSHKSFRAHPNGFTLLELLVSISILLLLSSLLFTAFNQASKAWMQAENQVDTFQGARAALDFMAKELSQAIVTTNIQFLANLNSLAFVAPVSTSTNDGADLVQVVYRLNYVPASGGTDATGIGGNNAPPQKLLRRTAVFSSGTLNCWNYGLGQPCVGTLPWNFYSQGQNWPEISDQSRTVVLAENIASINFLFTYTSDPTVAPVPYWISTTAYQSVWTHEIANGIDFTLGSQEGAEKAAMNNHTPLGVYITIGAIDARAASRLVPIVNANGGPTAYQTTLNNVGAYTNILNNSIQYFTTYVAIPNRTP